MKYNQIPNVKITLTRVIRKYSILSHCNQNYRKTKENPPNKEREKKGGRRDGRVEQRE